MYVYFTFIPLYQKLAILATTLHKHIVYSLTETAINSSV